ncbi:uncharacterized protein EV420DRAFT_1505978, partial [Desarmillaria tabescens]
EFISTGSLFLSCIASADSFILPSDIIRTHNTTLRCRRTWKRHVNANDSTKSISKLAGGELNGLVVNLLLKV